MSSRHIASGHFGGGGDRASSSKVTVNIQEAAPLEIDEIHQCGSHSPRDTNKGSTTVNIDNTEYSIIGYEEPIKLNERCVTFNGICDCVHILCHFFHETSLHMICASTHHTDKKHI